MSFFIEQSAWSFFIFTVALGGGAAFTSGRALAKDWRSPWLLFAYMLLFTAGIRFLHFALFEAELFSLKYYFSHGLVIEFAAWLGHRLTWARQMGEKYPWAYERTSPFTWRAKS